MSENQTPTNPAAELVAVVEDLVERQRQILAAIVTGRPPSRDSVQAVLLGLRGVVTKLRNGAADTTAPDARDDLLASIWLYVRWRYVTKHLTTEQKELWADAVDESDEPGPKADRWWRDVPGLNADCTADEAACVHGQTPDPAGTAMCECGHTFAEHPIAPAAMTETCGCDWFREDGTAAREDQP